MAKRTKKLAIVEPAPAVETPLFKVDFGCGSKKQEGFVGADCLAMEGVDHVFDLGTDPMPWADESVDEGYGSHFAEHLTAYQRVHFVNELYRVLKPGAKCVLIVPHWASCRAYGDPTHQWPPVSEFWFYYLNQKWRDDNAPHTDIKWNPQGFTCNFNCTWGYSIRPDILARNQEYQMFAMDNYKEACQDTCATLVKA